MSPKHAKLRSIRGRSLALILAIGIAGGIGIATLLGTDEPVRINVGNCSLGESTPPMLPAEVAERVQGVNRSDLDPLLFAMSPGKLLLQPNGDWLLIGTLTDEVRQQWRRLAKSGPPRRLVVNTAGGDESVALELNRPAFRRHLASLNLRPNWRCHEATELPPGIQERSRQAGAGARTSRC